MKYYKLIYDFENDDDYDYAMLKSDDITDFYDNRISKGEYIDCWDNDIKLKYNEDDGNILSDFLAIDNGWIIVSKKFCNVMHEILNENIQCLGIKIINETTNEENNTYKILNVTKHLDALDLDNSVYDIFQFGEDRVLSIEKYALKKTIIESNNIFKLDNETIPVFVSEKFKQVVEENNLIGFQFIEVKTV